jgi:toxin ParE1/3/4
MPRERFTLLPEAIEDIDAVSAFIAKDNPKAALGFVEQVFSTIEHLVSFPHIGHKNEKVAGTHIRFHAVHEYLVI